MAIRLTMTKPDGTTETREIALSECRIDGANLIIPDCPEPGVDTSIPLFEVETLRAMRDSLDDTGTVQDFERGKAKHAIQYALDHLAGKH